MTRPTAAQLFDYLSSLGANRSQALMLTGGATNESRLNPQAVHDNGSGYGMFGHRLDRLANMQSFAGAARPDWMQQAAFAYNELLKRPENRLLVDGATPEQIARAQMFYERPRGFSTASPESGDNYAGRLATLTRYAGVLGRDGASPQAMQMVDSATPTNSIAQDYPGGVEQGRGATYNAPWPRQFDQQTQMPPQMVDMIRSQLPPGVADVAHSYGLLPRPETLTPVDPARTFRAVDIQPQDDPNKRFAALGGDNGYS